MRVNSRAWAYTGIILGGAVSIAANVAHSYIPPANAAAGWTPPAGAVIGAVCWPLFLFIAIEIGARTTWPTGLRWALLRWLGLLPVALVAAVVSYRHLSGLLRHYGEDPLTTTIGPLAVDGLMVMATAALLATTKAGHTAGIAAGPAGDTIPATTIEAEPPATIPAAPAPLTVPTHLLPTARFATVQHEQATGRSITPAELAARMSITPVTAGQLLTALNTPDTTPTRVNGVPIGGGPS